MVKRSAFSMIELIFAIVLIGLVVAGVPQMLSRNDTTLQRNLVQQELFIAAKAASELLTQPWDQNSLDATTSLAYAKVLDVNPTNTTIFSRQTDALGNNLPYRLGHIREDNHRRFHNTVTTPAGFQIPNDTQQPTLPTSTVMQIKSGYSRQTAADFFQTTPTQSNAVASQTSAKMASITVTHDNNPDRNVTLRLYMANIGETAFAHRRF